MKLKIYSQNTVPEISMKFSLYSHITDPEIHTNLRLYSHNSCQGISVKLSYTAIL